MPATLMYAMSSGPGRVPVLVWLQWLLEAGPLPRRLPIPPVEKPGPMQDPVDAARADGGHVVVEHHEGQAAVAVERVGPVEGDDPLLFLLGDPVIARERGVVLIDPAVTGLPPCDGRSRICPWQCQSTPRCG